MNHSSAIKADFCRTTYPLVHFFNPAISEIEYTHFLLRQNAVMADHGSDGAVSDEFFVVLNGSPRNQGAIRVLHERVTTRLDVCGNPFRFWADKICGGSKSMIEPNAILGPFRGGRSRARRREVLARIKGKMVDARGIPQRLARLMEVARNEGVWLLPVIPPVLPTSQIEQLFATLEETCTEGIFAKREADL